jgi:hypothetical protein
MRREIKLSLIALLLIVIVSGTVTLAQSEGEYFPETGHFVSGEFFEFYSQNPNARIIYGLPITEQFYDTSIGRTTQYFQNARFELFPEYPAGQQVLRTQLGSALHDNGQLIEIAPTTAHCQQNADWRFPVCFSFLDFYREMDGETHFGKPITGIEYKNGRLIQQFEYAHFIWMPDNPEGARVALAPLGVQFFNRVGADPSLLDPIRNQEYDSYINQINALVFAHQAFVSQGDTQTINVLVKDQNNAPIDAALVAISIHYPNGRTETIDRIATNEFGIAESVVLVNSDQVGMVEVYVTITYNNLVSRAVTSFRMWY